MTIQTLDSRMAKLEAQHRTPEEPRAVHRIIAHSDEEAASEIAARITAGTARESDLFIVRRII